MRLSQALGVVATLVGTVAAVVVVPEFRQALCLDGCTTYEEVEAKVLRRELLTERDVAALEVIDLDRLRNAVFANNGHAFRSADLRAYFGARPWYRPRGEVGVDELGSADRQNVRLIEAAEERARD